VLRSLQQGGGSTGGLAFAAYQMQRREKGTPSNPPNAQLPPDPTSLPCKTFVGHTAILPLQRMLYLWVNPPVWAGTRR